MYHRNRKNYKIIRELQKTLNNQNEVEIPKQIWRRYTFLFQITLKIYSNKTKMIF